MIADTDVLIDYVNNAEPAASVVAAALRRRELVTTVISRFELQRGAARARRPGPLQNLITLLDALPLNAAAADRAAAVGRDLEQRGETFDRVDCLIAGIALVNREALLTRNRSHFGRVPGLRLMPLPDADEIQDAE